MARATPVSFCRRRNLSAAETVIGALEDAEDYKAIRGRYHCGLRCPVGARARAGPAISVSPWRTALQRETCLPVSGFLFGALKRIAAVRLDLLV